MYCTLEPIANSDHTYKDSLGKSMRVSIDNHNKWARIELQGKQIYLPYIVTGDYTGFKDDVYQLLQNPKGVCLLKNQKVVFKQHYEFFDN
ncbi:hypothetical protein [Myroides sp. LJL119]